MQAWICCAVCSLSPRFSPPALFPPTPCFSTSCTQMTLGILKEIRGLGDLTDLPVGVWDVSVHPLGKRGVEGERGEVWDGMGAAVIALHIVAQCNQTTCAALASGACSVLCPLFAGGGGLPHIGSMRSGLPLYLTLTHAFAVSSSE